MERVVKCFKCGASELIDSVLVRYITESKEHKCPTCGSVDLGEQIKSKLENQVVDKLYETTWGTIVLETIDGDRFVFSPTRDETVSFKSIENK